MSKEGKIKRVSTYRVSWVLEDQSGDEFVQALNAQAAVDFARLFLMPFGAEIVSVAKEVDNWK